MWLSLWPSDIRLDHVTGLVTSGAEAVWASALSSASPSCSYRAARWFLPSILLLFPTSWGGYRPDQDRSFSRDSRTVIQGQKLGLSLQVTWARNMLSKLLEVTVVGLNEKCPQSVSLPEHLFPCWWGCLGSSWNFKEAEPLLERNLSLLAVSPASSLLSAACRDELWAASFLTARPASPQTPVAMSPLLWWSVHQNKLFQTQVRFC